MTIRATLREDQWVENALGVVFDMMLKRGFDDLVKGFDLGGGRK